MAFAASSLRLKDSDGMPPGDVQVWCTTLCVQEHTLQTYAQLLSPDESLRAARFIFTEDQCRFVVARANLRLLLAEFLSCKPADLAFSTNEFGKPSVVGASTVHFNVSQCISKCSASRISFYALRIQQEEFATHHVISSGMTIETTALL